MGSITAKKTPIRLIPRASSYPSNPNNRRRALKLSGLPYYQLEHLSAKAVIADTIPTRSPYCPACPVSGKTTETSGETRPKERTPVSEPRRPSPNNARRRFRSGSAAWHATHTRISVYPHVGGSSLLTGSPLATDAIPSLNPFRPPGRWSFPIVRRGPNRPSHHEYPNHVAILMRAWRGQNPDPERENVIGTETPGNTGKRPKFMRRKAERLAT